ncbi:hypothetical protein HDU86_006912 [Geranomyces michiganensis]|nr:hypothetical protein HDU86_006912 [Geranomyces michiganensis]
MKRNIRGLSLVTSGSLTDDIVWLLVFGDMCDGALVAIHKDGNVSVEREIEDWSPTLDFDLADIYGEGRDTILMTSGMGDQGVIREVRVGIPVREHASENNGMEGATAIWSLKRRLTDVDDAFLVLTFLEETRIMSLENSELQDRGPFVAFETSLQTLFAGNLTVGNLHGQIHARGVVAADLCSEGGASARWLSNTPVLGGSISEDRVVIWTGDEIVALRVRVGSGVCSVPEISEEQRVHLNANPSCLFAFSAFPEHGGRHARFCAIGTFESSIILLSLDDATLLHTVARTVLDSGVRNVRIPQSFASLVSPGELHLLAGMRDGQLIDFTVTLEAGAGLPYSILQRHATYQVGVLPLVLVPATSGISPSSAVLGFSDNSWRVEHDSGRHGLQLTMISCPRTVQAAPFRFAQVTRGVMALIKGSLQFIELGERKEASSRTIKLGERHIPRRVLYDRHTRRAIVAVATKGAGSSAHYSDALQVQSEIRVIDVLSGKVFAKEKLEPNEKICALTEWNVKEGKGYICVGTWGYTPPDGALDEPLGRVLVYSLKAYERKEDSDDTRRGSAPKTGRKVVMYKLKQLGSISLAGPVHAICPFLNSYLLCAAGDSFVQLKIDAHTRTLVVRTSVATRWPVHSISVAGNRVAVGGQRDSLSLWDYDPDTKQFTFFQSDRYVRTISDCVAASVDSAIATDRAGNLLGFNAVAGVLETTLRTEFAIHLGEAVLRLHVGTLTSPAARPLGGADDKDDDDNNDDDDEGRRGMAWCWSGIRDDDNDDDDALGDCRTKRTEVLYGTSISGSLFAVLRIHADAFAALDRLQRIMAVHPVTRPILGNARNKHDRFRSQGLNQEWTGCIDGDMVEQFLTVPLAVQKEIMELWERDSSSEEKGVNAWWVGGAPLAMPGVGGMITLSDPEDMAWLIRTLQDACV